LNAIDLQRVQDLVKAIAAGEREFERKMAAPGANVTRFAMSMYAGNYSHPAYGTIRIRLTADIAHLEAAVLGSPAWYRFEHLWFETWGLFYNATSIAMRPFTFVVNDDDRIVSMTADLEPSFAPIVFSNEQYRAFGDSFQWPQTCAAVVLPPVPPVPPAPAPLGDVSLASSTTWTLIVATSVGSALTVTLVLGLFMACCRKRVSDSINMYSTLPGGR